MDHTRDLLQVVNHFRREMPVPIMGVGHSFGANIIVNLALIHPRLMFHLVLLDPVLSSFKTKGPAYGFPPMLLSSMRRDLWDSRAQAEASFRRSKFYETWDPRVFDAWIKYGLRDTPTKLYPEPGKVTLTSTKHQEVFTYYRPVAQAWDKDGNRYVDLSKLYDIGNQLDKYPDYPFYRPEAPTTTERLPSLRPSVFWLYGGKSEVCIPEIREEKRELTGVGHGGSGGVKAGRVTDVTIEEFGHLVPMEATKRCAEYAAASVLPELERWRQEEAEFQRWAERPDKEKQVIDDDWKRYLGQVKVKGRL
jgi:pimeloyl-ACP methyl ester carboxylesterase